MLTTIDNKIVHITDAQFDTLETMALLRNGGFASVIGYKPTTGYVTIPTVNIQFISKFSTLKLYDRRLAALQQVAFADLVITAPKLVAMEKNAQHSLFHDCVAAMIGSMMKTKDGDRSDAHRQAHDTFYVNRCEGVKCHLRTEKSKGETHLILAEDGNPIVDSIMLSIIEIGRKVIVEGQYKVVNSGEKVLMDNAIDKVIGKRSLSYKALSLKEDNHECVRMGGEVFDASLHEKVVEYV